MATFTSVSLVSTSPWYGPSSCPIISPSRWAQQVLDNLCVLALHNHSGSLGEGASTFSAIANIPTGQQEVINPYWPTASTNWFLQRNTNLYDEFEVGTCTNGASITYSVYLGTGLHTIQLLYSRSACGGILTGCLSGGSNLASPSSIDTQASGVRSYPAGSLATTASGTATMQFRVYTTEEFSASGSAVTGSLVGSGKYTLTLKVSGSNASSLGYQAFVHQIKID